MCVMPMLCAQAKSIDNQTLDILYKIEIFYIFLKNIGDRSNINPHVSFGPSLYDSADLELIFL